MTVATAKVRPPDEQTIGLLSAVVVLRIALLSWATIVVALDIRGTAQIRSGLALGILAALAVWSAVYGWGVRRRPELVLLWWVGVLDLALAALVAGADRLVYEGPHPQSFASAWPLCAAVVAGIVRGVRIGACAGAVIGVAGAVGVALFGEVGLQGGWMAAIGTLVLMTVSGALAGILTDLLRRAEMSAARAQAREDVARRLHDGVLQTLAVVQRRSDDPALVGLARDQELDLRHYIEDSEPHGSEDLVAEMRTTVAAAERRTSLRCELVVVERPPTTPAPTVAALCAATNEAITNAAKHATASRVVVCLDVEDHPSVLVCTVNDDGVGFEPASTPEGTGLSRSIRGRLEELGGTVQVTSRPGHGCEISMRIS